MAAASLVLRAYGFAERAHRGQRRKDGQAYIAHPVRVARMLAALGYGEEVLAAALLHDVLEDTRATPDDVRAAFGPRVSGLVAWVSEDPALPCDARTAAYHERVRVGPPEARAIFAADKVCNLDDLRRAAAAGDRVVIGRFRGGLPGQAQRFAAELGMLRETGADPALLDALDRGLRGLRRLAARAG